MKDLLGWFGLKGFPFDKHIKTQEVLDTEPFKECMARLDYIKRRAVSCFSLETLGWGRPSP